MNRPIPSREEKVLTSAIDNTLPITDDIFHMIRAFKMITMQEFLSGRHDHVTLETGASGIIESQWAVVPLKEITVSDQGIIQGTEDLSLYEDYYHHEGLPIMQAEFLSGLRFRSDKFQYLCEELRYAF